MQAYVARPKEEKKYAAIVVIHENRGLNAHIEDVTRRAANAGYLAIAPNALSSLVEHLQMKMRPEQNFRN
jgi:carboxymethylenebutenolidase